MKVKKSLLLGLSMAISSGVFAAPGGASTSANTGTSQASPQQTVQPPQANNPKFTPGSIVTVYSIDQLQRPTDGAGAYIYKSNAPYTIGMYKNNQDTSWIEADNIGLGISGWYKAPEDGRYSFTAKLYYPGETKSKRPEDKGKAFGYDEVAKMDCIYDLQIENKSVLQNRITVNKKRNEYYSKASGSVNNIKSNGIDLSKGFYRIDQFFGCLHEEMTTNPKLMDGNRHLKTVVELRIKKPSDLSSKLVGKKTFYYRKN